MPHSDGFAVLRMLAESVDLGHVTVVILSAGGSPETALEAMKLGAHANLTKPFSPAAVAELVRELIALPADEREARRQEQLLRAEEPARIRMPKI